MASIIFLHVVFSAVLHVVNLISGPFVFGSNSHVGRLVFIESAVFPLLVMFCPWDCKQTLNKCIQLQKDIALTPPLHHAAYYTVESL